MRENTKQRAPFRRNRRNPMDALLYAVMVAAFAGVGAILLCILAYILASGAGRLSFGFFTGAARDNGIFPMIVTTVYVVLASLGIALPVGIMTAVFLHEYAEDSKGARLLRLAIETLAGIPSILYGLFGLLFFCRFCKLGQSVIAGALTLSVMILPIIIRTVEESLKTIPQSVREASLSLGATAFQTLVHIVLPEALPGILTAAILAVGRVVGESAPVLLTVGIARNIPKSVFDSGRTLTIHLYYLTKEAIHPDDFETAFATAAALIMLVVVINTAAKIAARGLKKH
ncbi:MAG: phosphate ABC transporter permease PstA [Spirochaetaceae bacterium]|jgi:phosphate transport system permease protein|nr:phosphate ABC transporter permease PstA [Spirochaetaceae bacterium]